MQSTVSVRGQTVIPRHIREQLKITPATKLDWNVKNGVIIVLPLPSDPVHTSAVLTILNREDGLGAVLTLLDKAQDPGYVIYMPYMALMELEYLLLRRVSSEETMAILALVKAWPVKVQESTEEWRQRAATVKAQASLSVADAWIASLALVHNAELVHKDPEYEHLPDLLMVKLPYRADLS
jgi:predicted nucleic acid-binding protein